MTDLNHSPFSWLLLDIYNQLAKDCRMFWVLHVLSSEATGNYGFRSRGELGSGVLA